MKVRADQLLVTRGLAPSRPRAQALVLAGKVYVGEARIEKAGAMLAEDAAILVRGDDHAYVSRGGVKLEGALVTFGVDPTGKRCLDLGASTGGFTDCLLQRGAVSVAAVDVGYGQLAWPVRSDERVRVLERTNVRDLTADSLPYPPDLVVGDLSFISLRLVLPPLAAVATPDADLALMVKPQFEVGRELVGAGGVVRDPTLRSDAVRRIAVAAWGLGLGTAGVVASPLPGPSGNVEYFLHLRRGADPLEDADLARAIEEGPQ